VSLEWQRNYLKPVPQEDGRSLLSNVAERTEEVVSVQDGSMIFLVHSFS
jgi:hypothetical protein